MVGLKVGTKENRKSPQIQILQGWKRLNFSPPASKRRRPKQENLIKLRIWPSYQSIRLRRGPEVFLLCGNSFTAFLGKHIFF